MSILPNPSSEQWSWGMVVLEVGHNGPNLDRLIHVNHKNGITPYIKDAYDTRDSSSTPRHTRIRDPSQPPDPVETYIMPFQLPRCSLRTSAHHHNSISERHPTSLGLPASPSNRMAENIQAYRHLLGNRTSKNGVQLHPVAIAIEPSLHYQRIPLPALLSVGCRQIKVASWLWMGDHRTTGYNRP